LFHCSSGTDAHPLKRLPAKVVSVSSNGFEKLGIGPDKPPKLILDFCWNHEGSIGRVRQMLEALQRVLYTTVGDRSLYDLIIPKFQAGRDLPWDRAHYRGVKKMCEDEFGLPFLCTAFDYKAVDMLDSLDVAAIKIGSAEAIDPAFVLYASERKPLIISTGGTDIHEHWRLNISTLNSYIFMYCVSQYPPTAEQLALQAMHSPDWLIAGYSSHYPETIDAVFAMALHCWVIEKHYSLTPGAQGDHLVSISALQAKIICEASLAWHKMRGYTKSAETLEAERALLKPFRERFYAGNNRKTDLHPRQDQVAGDHAGREGSERIQPSDPAISKAS
jgi:sialic acid synthase SpsE